jgi:hypothetical protein
MFSSATTGSGRFLQSLAGFPVFESSTYVPIVICDLNLNLFQVGGNGLTALPSECGQLTNLTVLSVRKRRLV